MSLKDEFVGWIAIGAVLLIGWAFERLFKHNERHMDYGGEGQVWRGEEDER